MTSWVQPDIRRAVWSTEAIHVFHSVRQCCGPRRFLTMDGCAGGDPNTDRGGIAPPLFFLAKNAMQQWNASIPFELIDASKYDAVFVAVWKRSSVRLAVASGRCDSCC